MGAEVWMIGGEVTTIVWGVAVAPHPTAASASNNSPENTSQFLRELMLLLLLVYRCRKRMLRCQELGGWPDRRDGREPPDRQRERSLRQMDYMKSHDALS